MGRPRRNVAQGNRRVKEDVKDENTTVDTNVEGFYRDDVDKFHDEKEKLLLNVERDDASSVEQSDSGEEVFGLHLSDDEEEEEAEEGVKGESDEDGQVAAETFYASADEDGEEDQQPEVSDKAWGHSKKVFYNADDVEGMEGSEEEEVAELEEKEAMMLQKRLATGLDQEDFAAVDIALDEEREKAKLELQGQKETVAKDLSKLSSAEKMRIIEKDSPELVDLLSEFQDKLAYIATTLQPVLAGAKQRAPNLLTEPGEKYLETKLHLCQCYCLNILFYLLLKLNRVPVHNHPVIEVIVKIRQLMDKLRPMDESLNDQLEEAVRRLRGSSCGGSTGGGATMATRERVQIPERARGGEEARSRKRKPARSRKRKPAEGGGVVKETSTSSLKKLKVEPASKRDATVGDGEEDPLDYYYKVKAMKERKKVAKLVRSAPDIGECEEQDEVTDGKRAINYQIAKNKGLVPKRKKEQRNPRVKHRKKFEKAKIKHKSQVHPVIPELQRYGGERTGIRSTLSRSVRIK